MLVKTAHDRPLLERDPSSRTPPHPERLRLPGGRAVLLRPIRPQDADAEQAFVSGLSLDSRHKRFHIGLHQLSPTLLHQMIEVDQRHHVALVAQEVLPDRDGVPAAVARLVADARYVRNVVQPDEAEFAIVVADDWQSLGLGRALMARLADHARRNGVSAIFGDVLTENRRMIVLMRGLGASARTHPDGPQLVRVVFGLDKGGAEPFR